MTKNGFATIIQTGPKDDSGVVFNSSGYRVALSDGVGLSFLLVLRAGHRRHFSDPDEEFIHLVNVFLPVFQ